MLRDAKVTCGQTCTVYSFVERVMLVAVSDPRHETDRPCQSSCLDLSLLFSPQWRERGLRVNHRPATSDFMKPEMSAHEYSWLNRSYSCMSIFKHIDPGIFSNTRGMLWEQKFFGRSNSLAARQHCDIKLNRVRQMSLQGYSLAVFIHVVHVECYDFFRLNFVKIRFIIRWVLS